MKRSFLMLAALLALGPGCAPWAASSDPGSWTWRISHTEMGPWLVRYALPLGADQGGGWGAALRETPPPRGALPFDLAGSYRRGPRPEVRESRVAAHHYSCRARGGACSIAVDLWRIEFTRPLADPGIEAYRARLAELHPADTEHRAEIRDELFPVGDTLWVLRQVEDPSGARFVHYSRPLDARFALALTSYSLRGDDAGLVPALAREAAARVEVRAQGEPAAGGPS